MKQNEFKVKILDEWFKVILMPIEDHPPGTPGRGTYGDIGIDDEDKVLRIDPRQSKTNLHDSIIHELFHHFKPEAKEKEVRHFCKIIKRIEAQLQRRGYL